MLQLAMPIGSIAFCASCSLALGVVLNAAISSLSYNQVLLSLVRPVLSVMDLNNLNKSSAKVADFPVTMSMGKILEYSYTSKKDCSTVKAQKFEVYVVGQKPEAYCIGYVKGNMEACRKAHQKFCDGSPWTLSKVAFDPYTNAAYINTPVPFRIDLTKSTLVSSGSSDGSNPPVPVPPRSVADIARIKTNKASDLIAMVKEVKRERLNKNDHTIADVTLIDNSEMRPGKLAVAVISVWGKDKIELLKQHVGEPMVFFNLSIVATKDSTDINHYVDEVATRPPVCPKTEALTNKKTELATATNTELLTQTWTPSQGKDVSGRQPLSCSAFLDYSSSTPEANVPEVVQLMWLHLEEPEAKADVLHQDRVWYKVCARDVSGGIQVGIPQRNALSLASCSTMEEFVAKHEGGELNMPLLCHVRVSRNIKTLSEETLSQGTQGAAAQRAYVNYIVEDVEAVSWNLGSRPNASYNQVLGILNNCPPHAEGIGFVYLADVESDPHYGFRITYDEVEGTKCIYFAALIGCETKSTTERVGTGFRVVTSKVKDVANPTCTVSGHADAEPTAGAATQRADPSYITVGYCTLNDLTGFRMDPPRGKAMRCALVLFTKKDEEGFHIHKLECIEPDQVENAIACLRKLRTLSKRVQPVALEGRKEKRAHKLFLEAAKRAPVEAKKARTLKEAPTDQELEEYHAKVASTLD